MKFEKIYEEILKEAPRGSRTPEELAQDVSYGLEELGDRIKNITKTDKPEKYVLRFHRTGESVLEKINNMINIIDSMEKKGK
jgi:uncharacterized protein Yka (UPF0111/DUF47 family)